MTDPGWYPDPQVPGTQRYWDGNAWTDHTAAGGPGGGGAQPQQWVQQGYGYAQGGSPPRAGFWIRFAAYLLDAIIVGIPAAILVSAIVGGSASFGTAYNPGLDVAANLLSTAIGVAYYALLEGGKTGQTLGKKICGIRVVDQTTFQPGVGIGRGIGRYFARWLSGIPLGLGYFWMLWDDNKQTWHDKLTKVVVIKG